jgi:transposase-like protein
MNTYKRHRFPPDIISYAVWLYYRFNLSHRDIEDLLAERGNIVTPEWIRSTKQYENNRAEQSHEATRVRERGMRRFKSMKQAQRFVTAHAAVHNLFNLGRQLIKAEHYRNLRISAFSDWGRAVA